MSLLPPTVPLNEHHSLNRAKNAIKEFRKRLLDSSGNSVYLTFLVLDSLMKNCTSDVHTEVLCVEFMTVLKTVITTSKVRIPSTKCTAISAGDSMA